MLHRPFLRWILLLVLALPIPAPFAQEDQSRIHAKSDHPQNGKPVQKKSGRGQITDQQSAAACLEILGSMATVDYSRPEGPRILVRPPLLPGAVLPASLKIGSYNIENLLDYMGQREYDPVTDKWVWTADPYQKPPARLDSNVDVELRSHDDLGFWVEVEGARPAMRVIRDRLGGEYLVITVEGQDVRGIDLIFRFRKDLPFWYEFLSHRNLDFSRDLPVVLVRPAGTSEASEPLMILAGTHFKSQRDGPNDPLSTKARTRQVVTAMQILLGFQKKYPSTPIFLMGDFNADIRTAEEFRAIWAAGFRDSFDVKQSIALADRITQIYFPRGGEPVRSQLDAIVLNTTAIAADVLLAAQIIPYLNADGTVMALPRTIEERLKQGSDHRKIQVIVDLAKILREYNARQAR